MMKKALIWLLALTLLLSLCACGGNGTKETAPTTVPSATGSNLTAEEIDRLAEERLAEIEKAEREAQEANQTVSAS